MRATASSSKATAPTSFPPSGPTEPPPRRRGRPPRSPPRRVDPLPNPAAAGASPSSPVDAAAGAAASPPWTAVPRRSRRLSSVVLLAVAAAASASSKPSAAAASTSSSPTDTVPQEMMTRHERDALPASSPQPDEPSTEKRKRGGRGRSKMPKGQYTITHVTEDGQPMLPQTAVSAFRRACSVIGRTKIKITYKDWKKVPNTEKAVLWETIKGMFEMPEGAHDSMQRQAMLKIGKVWRNFKSELYNTYVKQDLTPFHQKEFAHLRDQWDEFVQRCRTPEFLHQSKVNKVIQAFNTHHHRLGTSGYVGKSLQWEKEDKEAAQLSHPIPFANIKVQRARNWVRARAITTSDGNISFANTETEQVAQRVQQLAEDSFQGSFQSCRENDILTAALGTKEHSGRTRGLGATVPWKAGFADSAGSYKRQRRSKVECEEINLAQLKRDIFDELAAKIDREVEEKLQQALNQKSAASTVEGSPNMIQGICGAVPHSHPGGSIVHDKYPVDGINVHTKCKIQVPIGVDSNFIIDAVEGTVYPCNDDALVQGVQLATGYGKVRVDMVYPNFTAFPLPLPLNEIMTLGQALHKFIQWPKKDIALPT